MTSAERWLAGMWPFVRAHLPAAPAPVAEIGCGSLGGFVPMLQADGYQALGIDPQAPVEAGYRRIAFERAELPERVDAIVASTSLHHVADPAAVIDRISETLAPGGVAVVIEWAWERFDERTAEWCFSRLPADGEGWLRNRREEWLASGRDWSGYLQEWAGREELHAGELLVRLLDERLERRVLAHGPYFFPDLADTTEAHEQAAIDAGRIQATRIDWVGVG